MKGAKMKVEELTVEEIVRIVKQNNVKVVISVNGNDNGYEVSIEPTNMPFTWSSTTSPCIVAK